MALDGTAGKNAAAQGFIGQATYGAVYSAAPTGGAQGAELSGVARQALTWGTVTNGVATAVATFSGFASGATVAGAGMHTAVTSGTYLSGGSITSRTMQTGDTLQVTFTVTFS
jgi:hypothetical protein